MHIRKLILFFFLFLGSVSPPVMGDQWTAGILTNMDADLNRGFNNLNSNVTQGNTDIITAINSLIAGYGALTSSQLFSPPYLFSQELGLTYQLANANRTLKKQERERVDFVTSAYALTNDPSGKNTLKVGTTEATQVVATIPTTAYHDPETQKPDNNNLSAETLFGALQFANENEDGQRSNNKEPLYTKQNATNFVLSLMHFGGAKSLLPSESTGVVNPNSSLAYYLANYYGYVAVQSLAASNFNHLMTARQVVKNLGCDAGIASSNACQQAGYRNYKPVAPNSTVPADVSPATLAHYSATYRLENPDWKMEMGTKATPSQIEKETLFVLSEIRYELHQLHLDNERMLAALTTMLVQNNVIYRGTALAIAKAQGPSNKNNSNSSAAILKGAEQTLPSAPTA